MSTQQTVKDWDAEKYIHYSCLHLFIYMLIKESQKDKIFIYFDYWFSLIKAKSWNIPCLRNGDTTHVLVSRLCCNDVCLSCTQVQLLQMSPLY